ncbi:MAG: hypothetical protein KJ620_09415 [Candidatus Edwardsbacteria bacterium]|nr:hypothetical protein [Candidatus Edwardsbacteria bacterium]MBU1575985.1 hypothetical protein [Candidatus Edwardsbacteria bacterium]MBU2464131.1 hypothetical protein [Candidatus Edwardsbacteria bacterium]MBU2595062.1 hypothetical protein [Candidatus Edwardsbacteria bacterium]
MRKTSCLTALAAVLFLFSIPLAATPVEVGLGTLRLGGNLQTVYGYSQTGKWSFAAKRVRLILNGDLPEQRLKYLVQLEALTSPALLDARIQASGYLPKTDLMLGRFIPSFSLYMPRSTAALEMINYPVVLTKFAMWRQMGMQTTTKLQPVELSIGLFNGYPANNYADNNKGKDLLFSVTAKPADFLQFLGYSWLGNSVQKGSQDTLKNRYGGGFSIEHKLGQSMLLIVRSEVIAGQDRLPFSGGMVKSGGYYAHLGLRPHPKIEVLTRWDKFDTERSDDGTAWLTLGANYYLSGTNAMIYANYIRKKMEQPGAPHNDEFAIQVQLAF